MVERKTISGWLVGVLVVLSTGCSTIHHYRWRTAGEVSEAEAGLAGRWEGTWTSGTSDHGGKLRCIARPLEGNAYDLHYWATWSIFSGTYRLKVRVNEEDRDFRFEGSKNLGRWAGGEYRFTGRVREDRFDAQYASENDQGEFAMKRVVD